MQNKDIACTQKRGLRDSYLKGAPGIEDRPQKTHEDFQQRVWLCQIKSKEVGISNQYVISVYDKNFVHSLLRALEWRKDPLIDPNSVIKNDCFLMLKTILESFYSTNFGINLHGTSKFP